MTTPTRPGPSLRDLGDVVPRLLALLPRGTSLPEDTWQGRHRGILVLLWVHVAALPVVGVLRGETLAHAGLETGFVAALAAGARLRRLPRDTRAGLATVGLLMCSAILTHFFDGLIELHFHFFVMVVVISLYQSWRPFLLALAFVVLHHAFGGLIAINVYDHPAAQSLLWALVHAGFVLAQSVACLACWRASERTLAQERDARDALHRAHEDLAAAQALAGVGSWDWDMATGVVSWSDQFYVIAGRSRTTETPTVDAFLDLVHDDDRERVAALIGISLKQHTPLDYECRMMRPDGTVRIIHALGQCSLDGGGLVKMLGTCQDITERKLLQQEIERLAFHDPLTGLANRRLLLDRIEHALTLHQRSGQPSALLFLDLDGFKSINDSHGHSVGDQLLVEVARRLQAEVRSHDTVARFGGDEFAVLLEGLGAEHALATVERIQAALRAPLQFEGAQISTSASVGLALTEGNQAADDLLRDVDAAMYAAKRQGKNSHSIFPTPRAYS